MENAFIEYKVVLKDSDPSTPEGKAALRDKLISFLGISEDRVNDLIDSLPVTLKTGVTEEEAKAFAKILRELGALVFVEKTLNVEEEQVQANSYNRAPSLTGLDRQKILQHPYFLGVVGLAIVGLLVASLFKPAAQPGIVIDADSLTKMLASQKSITEGTAAAKKAQKKAAAEKYYSGKSYHRPLALTVDVMEVDKKIYSAIIKFATESPGDPTPEQIIRGVQLPWLQEGEARFDRSKVRKIKNKSRERVKTDARLYIFRGELNDRIVAEASLEILPSISKLEHRYLFRLRYKPQDQFNTDPYFIEYKDDKGYSIVINQEITLLEKEKTEESPLIKLTTEDALKKAEALKSKAGKVKKAATEAPASSAASASQ